MSDRVTSGIDGLDELLGGGLPRGGLIVLSGNPGTGKTIFSAQFLYRGAVDRGEKGVYVSFAEDKEAFYRNMRAFGFDFEKLEREGLFSFLDMLTVREAGISTLLELVIGRVAELGAKRLVVDSFSAMAQAFREPHDARIVLHTILGKLVRSMGCTTLLIVEIPHGTSRIGLGVEEFVADGIIVLKRELLDGRPFRVLEVMKMRGLPTPKAQTVFTLKGGFRVFLPFKLKGVEAPRRFKPRPDSEERFSTGSPDLDEVLGGGYPRSSFVLIEIDRGITIPQYHSIVVPTVWNFLAQGRGVFMIPSAGEEQITIKRRVLEGGFTADELNNLLRVCIRHYPELRPEPYIVSFKGEDVGEDYGKLTSAIAEVRRRTRRPLLHVVGVDSLIDVYGEREILLHLRLAATIGKVMGDLIVVLLRPGYPRAAEVLSGAADVHLRITREHGVVLVYGVKPMTNVYALEMDTSEGYPMPKLTQVI